MTPTGMRISAATPGRMTHGLPVPSNLATDAEVIALCAVLAEFDHGAVEIIPRSFPEGYDDADRALLRSIAGFGPQPRGRIMIGDRDVVGLDPWRLSVAPMMEWTDSRCRNFHRLLTRQTLLYTEMITTGAVLHGDRARLLRFDPAEHPVALQLGGSDPQALAQSAAIAQDVGYDEVNLNVGCPSDRVQDGRFGACLMAEPQLVGDCVAAMKAVVNIPVTVKCRIGIDQQDPEAALETLTQAVKAARVDALIVHARKAWLEGLSPREAIRSVRLPSVRASTSSALTARWLRQASRLPKQ